MLFRSHPAGKPMKQNPYYWDIGVYPSIGRFIRARETPASRRGSRFQVDASHTTVQLQPDSHPVALPALHCSLGAHPDYHPLPRTSPSIGHVDDEWQHPAARERLGLSAPTSASEDSSGAEGRMEGRRREGVPGCVNHSGLPRAGDEVRLRRSAEDVGEPVC